jgi:photosystem II stability/assembly factor-like uncharacterized protein
MRDFDGIEVSSRRRNRTIGLVAAGLVVVAAAGFVYLHPLGTAARSTDTVAPSPTPPAGAIVAADFETTTTGYVEVLPWAGFARIFRTTDGGQHWRVAYEGPVVGYLSAFADGQLLLAAGTHKIFVAADLAVRAIPAPRDDPNAVVAFATVDRGLIVDRGAAWMYTTADSGEHWSQPARRGFPTSGYIVDAGYHANGFAWALVRPYAGADGATVFVSRDSGQDWRALPLPPVEASQALFIQDDGGSLVVLRNSWRTLPWVVSEVFRLPAGATAWQPLDLPPVTYAPRLAASGGSVWVVAGREVWRNSAGAWVAGQQLPAFPAIHYFGAYAANVLLVASDQSKVFALSGDGGAHWSTLPIPS